MVKLMKLPRYHVAETRMKGLRDQCRNGGHLPDMEGVADSQPAALFCRCGDITWYPANTGAVA
jgi:hypothetical protein